MNLKYTLRNKNIKLNNIDDKNISSTITITTLRDH